MSIFNKILKGAKQEVDKASTFVVGQNIFSKNYRCCVCGRVLIVRPNERVNENALFCPSCYQKEASKFKIINTPKGRFIPYNRAITPQLLKIMDEQQDKNKRMTPQEWKAFGEVQERENINKRKARK